MYWTCSCGTKNPENSIKCGKCSKPSPAPKKFYAGIIITGAVVFAMIYGLGVMIGGTLVAFSVTPTNEDILVQAKIIGEERGLKFVATINDLEKEDQPLAEKAAVEKVTKDMSLLVRSILLWIVPFLLFPIIGIAVGFISEGRTILEGAIAATAGQIIGFLAGRFAFHVDIHIIELLVGLVVGFLLVAAGAYMGEAIQEKRERASLAAQDEEEAFY
jgi:hypothetical protein